MRAFVGRNKKRIVLFSLCALLVIASLLCLSHSVKLSNGLDSQLAAQRWQGESETGFAQVSCYIPVGSEISLEDVYTFRYAMIKAMEDASMSVSGEDALWEDAWCSFAKYTASSSLGKGEVSVTAVGGEFFNFHPLRLVSGSYIYPDDLMKDRALLDRESAWLLFGSDEVQGLSFELGEKSFTVAGVIEREDGKATELSYDGGMGIFISYDALCELDETAGISCYEYVMAEPVKGFARSTAEASFPINGGEIIDNTNRFDAIRVLGFALHPFRRVIQTNGVLYPYWENAARYTEMLCGSYRLWALVLMILPAGVFVWYSVKLIRRGKTKLEDELIPEAKDNIEERVRVVQRRRWEKYHGKH